MSLFLWLSERDKGCKGGLGQAERTTTNEQTNEWLTVEEVKREANT